MISGYLGKNDTFEQAISAFAFGYADQTERDYEALVAVVKTGCLKGLPEVAPATSLSKLKIDTTVPLSLKPKE